MPTGFKIPDPGPAAFQVGTGIEGVKASCDCSVHPPGDGPESGRPRLSVGEALRRGTGPPLR